MNPNIIELIQMVIRQELAHHFTVMPAEVLDYDAERQRVSVRPLLRFPRQDRVGLTYIEPGKLHDLPVVIPASAASGEYLTLAEGDRVLLFTSMYSIDELLDSDVAGPVNPRDPRQAQLMDSFAMPIQNWNATPTTHERAAKRAITGTDIRVGNAQTAESLVTEAGMQVIINRLISTLDALLTVQIPLGAYAAGAWAGAIASAGGADVPGTSHLKGS